MFASIIVPVYNSEHYLGKCLDSLSCQTFKDFEVIMVDDGSTDHSQALCLSRCQDDQRFKLITHDENKGASEARNTGIANATGDYILFLDNDDWWEGVDALQNLHKAALRWHYPDLICYPMSEYYPIENQIHRPCYRFEQQANMIGDFFECSTFLIANGLFYSSASGKAVKRKLIERHGIVFDGSLRYNEDTDWSRALLCCANSIKWIDAPFYVYRRNSSVSQSTSSSIREVAESLKTINNKHMLAIEDSTMDKRRVACTSNFIAYAYVLLLSYLFMEENTESKRERTRQKKNDWLLAYNANKRVSYGEKCKKIIGYNFTGHLLAATMKRERKRIRNS